MLPFSFQDLQNFSQTSRTATLNCALGRYTTQQWRGAALQDVLEHAATGSGGVGVPLESLTGYAHSLLLNEARDVLLAAHAGDELLGHWHGAPAACDGALSPGWFWVKWLSCSVIQSQSPIWHIDSHSFFNISCNQRPLLPGGNGIGPVSIQQS